MKPVYVPKSTFAVKHQPSFEGTLSHTVSDGAFHAHADFALVDGPPYANGDAHLGHALNKLMKDMFVRTHRVMGQSVDFQPGWDCHGLPLELHVERLHGQVDTPTLFRLASEQALRSYRDQCGQFRSLGVAADWGRPYLTLSPEMRQSSYKSLKVLLEKNLLSYRPYPVHHCPSCGSSLAEAELESAKKDKHKLYWTMPVSRGDEHFQAVVFTTTPWTVPMNQALAVHPELDYGFYLVEGVTYVVSLDHNVDFVSNTTPERVVKGSYFEGFMSENPVTQHPSPVWMADFVEPGLTGWVHVVAAHGPEDFELCHANGVAPMSLLNKEGHFDETVSWLSNMYYLKANKAVVDYLTEKNVLCHHSVTQEDVQVCWRHKTPVYYRAASQVFLELHTVRERVLSVLENSSLSEQVKHRLAGMVSSRPHWCLSRQRRWGTPLYFVSRHNTFDASLTLSLLEALSHGVEDEVVQHFLAQHPDVELNRDVLDVWFDSGNVVNHRLFNGLSTADLVVEGKDQYRGWFQSLLWLTVAVHDVMPFKHVVCHGFVLDERRRKLSKSEGNAEPLETLQQRYGNDVLRVWAASQEEGLDAVFAPSKLQACEGVLKRFRLTVRFLESVLKDEKEMYPVNLTTHPRADMHRYTLQKVSKGLQEVVKAWKDYNLKMGLEKLYQLLETVSHQYFDVVKNTLYLDDVTSEDRQLAVNALHELSKMVVPFLNVYAPFMTAEFGVSGSVAMSSYDVGVVHHDWDTYYRLRGEHLAKLEPLQQNKTVKSRQEVGLTLPVDLPDVCRWEDFFHTSYVAHGDYRMHVLTSDAAYHKCPRCWNYVQKHCERCE